jgi:hypothetical protein
MPSCRSRTIFPTTYCLGEHMRGVLSNVPTRIVALILGVGALLTSIGAITGFWDAQVLHNTPDTTAVEIVLDASATMNEPLNANAGGRESKWNSAKDFVLDFATARNVSSNSYISLRRFGGLCSSSSMVGTDQRPTVDWPATRYFLGSWQLSGGNDNGIGLRSALEAIQPGGDATIWAAVEDAIGHLVRGPANLGKAKRQLILIYSASAVDACHQFALDRLAAEMNTGDTKLIPISLGEASPAPDNISNQVIELARRLGVQVASPSSQAQLNQALQTALPVPPLTTTPLAAPTALPAASLTPRPLVTLTVSPAATVTALPSASPTPRTAATMTVLPSASPTPRSEPSLTAQPAASLTALPAASVTPRPLSTPTFSLATTPTSGPIVTPTATATTTRTPAP